MRILFTISCFLVIAFFMGCSSGNENPTAPANMPLSLQSSIPVGVSDYASDGTPIAGMGALGIFNLEIDPANLTANLISLRNSSSTDVLEVVDITNFMSIFPCTNCAKIKSVGLDPFGSIVISIGIKHPFGAGDPLKPISGRNRADLHVFNIEGIIVSNTPGTDFPLLSESTAGFHLLNASGYTAYLDNAIDAIYPTAATVHPYRLHFDDYSQGNFNSGNPMGFASVTDPPPTGNLVMAMGCDYDFKDYLFHIPTGGAIDAMLVIGCTYAVSADNASQRFTPQYRIPQHNKKAASEMKAFITENHLVDGNDASYADLRILVVDISNKVAVGLALDQMLSDSSVNDIFVDVPDLMFDMLVLDGNNPVSGTGHDTNDPLVYEGQIHNTRAAAAGTYYGLVKVTDNYATGQNTSPLLSGMDGIKRVGPIENPLTGLFSIPEFATYQLFQVDVASNAPPTAALTSVPYPANIGSGQAIDLDASASSDTEDDTFGLPLNFEFEWDYDGVNFNPDFGPTTNPVITTPPYDTLGDFVAAVRVTDSGGLTDIATIDISVLEMTDMVVFMHGVSSLYTCMADGTNVKDIRINGYNPCIAQSSNVIVYTTNYNGNVRACDPDGSNDRLVRTGSYCYPSVSANGQIITFYQNASEPTSCYRVNLDGSGFIKISPMDTCNWRYAQISGAGNRVVMHRMDGTPQFAVYVCDPDGSNLKWITADTPDYPIYYCTITYDGQYVFYNASTGIWRVKYDGSDFKRMEASNSIKQWTSSPDGNLLGYKRVEGGQVDVFVYNCDLETETRLTNDNTDNGNKTISPSGLWIVWDTAAGPTGKLLTAKTDGSMAIPITIDTTAGYPSANGIICHH